MIRYYLFIDSALLRKEYVQTTVFVQLFSDLIRLYVLKGLRQILDNMGYLIPT